MMIYLTYNNNGCQDGVGAQAQRILTIYLISQHLGWQYIHTPIIACEHNLDSTSLCQFNQSLQLPSSDSLPKHFRLIFQTTINVPQIQRMAHRFNGDFLVKITFAHNYLDQNVFLLDHPFPHVFSWVDSILHLPRILAIHIRRGDVSSTQHQERYIPWEKYQQCIKCLQQSIVVPYQIHLYSENSIRSEILSSMESIIFHLDESVPQTFQALVNADLLVAGFSSLSYAASLLRRKGLILHPPYWHQYSTHALNWETPELQRRISTTMN
jgi:hypothetical protein